MHLCRLYFESGLTTVTAYKTKRYAETTITTSSGKRPAEEEELLITTLATIMRGGVGVGLNDSCHHLEVAPEKMFGTQGGAYRFTTGVDPKSRVLVHFVREICRRFPILSTNQSGRL